MNSSPDAPAALSELQTAFGESIATPFEFTSEEGDYRLMTERYHPDALEQITPRAGLSPAERLSTYNRQYWFRLFTVMQEEFPLLRHLLGLSRFNKLVSDYLVRFPPSAPSLRELSNRLTDFLSEEGPWNKPQLQECAELELCYIHAFDAADQPTLRPEELSPQEQEDLLGSALRLQPHFQLFEEHWNLMSWREQVREDADDDVEVALSKEQAWWALYRLDNQLLREPLGPIQFQLLSALSAGQSLETACALLSAQLEETTHDFLEDNIQGWFARWTSLGWFVHPPHLASSDG